MSFEEERARRWNLRRCWRGGGEGWEGGAVVIMASSGVVSIDLLEEVCEGKRKGGREEAREATSKEMRGEICVVGDERSNKQADELVISESTNRSTSQNKSNIVFSCFLIFHAKDNFHSLSCVL